MVPLKAGSVDARIILISGPFTPVFGADETERLQGRYATAVAMALERAGLTERLAAVEHSKTEFLNLASHEMRGPLTGLRGYLTMLVSGDLGTLPDKAQSVVPVLLRQTKQMGLIVDQMLETARLTDDRLQLRFKRSDLASLVEAAVAEARPLLPDTHKLTLALPKSPVFVSCDSERVNTIIANLLDNAIKYSPAGGAVTCDLRCRGETAEFHVTDQGMGIKRADIGKLFTRFGRIVTAENAHIPGTGLGLYICRELARRHGGDLTVKSSPGKGTTFTLRLPLDLSLASD